MPRRLWDPGHDAAARRQRAPSTRAPPGRQECPGQAQPPAQVERLVGGQRRGQVQRGRQARGGTQPAPDAALEHDDVEALLQIEPVPHADARREPEKRLAAPEEHVLAVVDLVSVDLERRRAPAEETRTLEDFHFAAARFEFESRAQPGEAGADDRDAG